jgi:periplasmic divalent cation tolerance protein
MSVAFVYITVKDATQAAAIGHSLVDERLAACVNIFAGMLSICRWEGEIEEAGEVVVIAKTREDVVTRLIERVRHLHSYACPCVVSWRIDQGHQPFLDWIEKESG